MTLKLFIIGAGKIAGGCGPSMEFLSHADACSRLSELGLCGVVDRTLNRARQFAEYWKIPAFESVAEGLDQTQPDIVAICSSNEAHFANLLEIMESGFVPKVIVVEKPVCNTLAEFTKLSEMASKGQLYVVINHNRRFDRRYARLVEVIRQQGWLGKEVEIRASYYGGWMTIGIHLVDMLHQITGLVFQPTELTRKLAGRGLTDPLFDMSGILAAGRMQIPVFINSFDETHFQIFELDVRYRDGRVQIYDFGNDFAVHRVETNNLGERYLVPFFDSKEDEKIYPMAEMYRQVVDFCQGKTPFDQVACTLRDVDQTMHALFQGVQLYDA